MMTTKLVPFCGCAVPFFSSSAKATRAACMLSPLSSRVSLRRAMFIHSIVVNGRGRERIPPPEGYHKLVLLQLVLVVTTGWNAQTGELTRWERDGGRWRQVGPAVAVFVGEAGMAWGRGLHRPAASRIERLHLPAASRLERPAASPIVAGPAARQKRED